jgi:hypothetical protein
VAARPQVGGRGAGWAFRATHGGLTVGAVPGLPQYPQVPLLPGRARLTLTALMSELSVEPLFAARGGGASIAICTFGRGVTTCMAAAAAVPGAGGSTGQQQQPPPLVRTWMWMKHCVDYALCRFSRLL